MNEWKNYMLIAEWEIDDLIHQWTKYNFYFDTKEEMIDFVKNGNENIKPEQIKVIASYKLEKLNNNIFVED